MPGVATNNGTSGGNLFDGSGWNVTFGDGAGITSNREEEKGPLVSSSPDIGGVAGMGGWLPYIALAFGAVVLIRMTRKK
jgi:hypothetical protein